MLEVRLLGLRGLTLLSDVGYYQPTVSVTVGGDVSAMAAQRSATPMAKNNEIKLNKTFAFEVPWPLPVDASASTHKVHVQVFDHDDSATPFRIGEVLFNLSDFTRGPVLGWYKLQSSSGEIQISFKPPGDHSMLSASTGSLPSAVTAPAPVNVGHSRSAPALDSSSSSNKNNNMNIRNKNNSQDASSSSDEGVDEAGVSGDEERGRMRHLKTHIFRKEPVLAQRSLTHYIPGQISREYPHIAKGGFGVVFKGNVSDRGDESVVIKDQDVQDEQSVDDWRREVELMRALRSPHVAEIFGYASTPSTLTIVMEYFPNGDLFGVLHKKADKHALSMLQRMRMARHCSLGLAHLHSCQIMHRDVKSMNVLVTEDYACKLTDFGCSKLLGDKAHAAQLELQTKGVGSPLWMAPEVRGSEQYGFPGDVYSLGLVLYEIFEKKLPQYDKVEQHAVVPAKFNSAPMVLPCLHALPGKRPAASAVVKFVDSMIRNVLQAVCTLLPLSEQQEIASSYATTTIGAKDKDKDKAEGDDTTALWSAVYAHLLTRPPIEVDTLINQAFALPQVQHAAPTTSPSPAPSPAPAPAPAASSSPAPAPGPGKKDNNKKDKRENKKGKPQSRDPSPDAPTLQPPKALDKVKDRSKSPSRDKADKDKVDKVEKADKAAGPSPSPSPSPSPAPSSAGVPAASPLPPARHLRKGSVSPAVEVVACWVDNDITSREHTGSVAVLTRECPELKLTSLRSTTEAIAWLHALPPAPVAAARRVLCLTSRFRKDDGGDQAAAQLIKALRQDKKGGKDVAVMIYCGNKLKVLDLTKDDPLVKAADIFNEVVAFCRAALS